MTDQAFIRGLAAWIKDGGSDRVDLGVEPEEIRTATSRFLGSIELEGTPLRTRALVASDIELLRSACQQLASAGDISDRLRRGDLLYQFISKVEWPEPEFEERSELLWECALSMWREARNEGDPRVTDRWLKRLSLAFVSLGPLREALICSLEDNVEEHLTLESIVAASLFLTAEMETTPAEVLSLAIRLYTELRRMPPGGATEQETRYLRGEVALQAGVACRMLARRLEAKEWFGRAAREFEPEPRGSADRARLLYQELALALEERRFAWVMGELPSLVEAFERLALSQDQLKARFLEGIALMETERLTQAIVLYRDLFSRAVALGYQRLAATASYNMVQIHGMLGDADAALSEAAVAVPLLRQLDNRVGLAKIQWGLGGLLRTQGKLEAAIENYRAAQGEFRDIGMRADLAALHLVIADLLIERGEEALAMSEVLAALPIIEEEKMVPEGMAALALLRESVRAQRLNRQALRDLHGYFEELA